MFFFSSADFVITSLQKNSSADKEGLLKKLFENKNGIRIIQKERKSERVMCLLGGGGG